MPPDDSEVVLEINKPDNTPVRIGLISDTHIPRDTMALPPHVAEAFKGVDLILHAGDIYTTEVLDSLETIAPVLAAEGNGDWQFPEDARFSENHTITINGLNLGVTHAIHYPGARPDDFRRTIEARFGRVMDIVVFGDTHVELVGNYEGVLLVNPGSPAIPSGRFELGTVALLEITGKKIEARIVRLSEFPIPFQRELVYYRGAGA